jgi:hypothetical protein
MNASSPTSYLGYDIAITQDKMRFTARVTREGALISHNNRNSEVWASESCGSSDRAIWVAKNAIDTGLIE